MTSLKREVIKITNLKVGFRSLATTGHVDINDYLTIFYTEFRISSQLEVSIYRGDIRYNFGCQSYSVDQIELALDNLNGKNTSTTKEVLVLKKTGKGRISSPIVEESDNFFITKGGKAISKLTHERKKVEIKRSILTVGVTRIAIRGGYSIYMTPQILKEKLLYLLDINDEYIKELKLQEDAKV